jgi:proline dehydrogenase
MHQTDTSTTIRLDNTEVAFQHREPSELKKMEWMFTLMNHSTLNPLSIKLLLWAIDWKLPVQSLVKATIFGHFCGGETLEECLKTIEKQSKYHVGTILDYSVEGEKTDRGFDRVEKETLSTISIAANRPDVPFAVFKTSGIASVDLLEKAQKGEELDGPEMDALRKARNRFARICQTAAEKQVRIFVDGEESWIQDIIDAWTYEEMAIHNKEKAFIFNTYQLYRHDILDRLRKAGEAAKASGYVLGAKLVRGAYMEKEAAYAQKAGKKTPIQPSKEATDRDFNAGWRYCLDNIDHVHFCCGSHNEDSNRLLAEEMMGRGMNRKDERVWFAQLFGMSDNISYALAKEGFNVAKYVPYGPVFSVMPYLVRRAAENTSVAGQTSRELGLIRKELQRRKRK